ncbi:MAG TPA: VTT domain-containing protein [Syntrophales bacterium]|nr:VTT domain-containing protein [Syntrophales bacterium]
MADIDRYVSREGWLSGQGKLKGFILFLAILVVLAILWRWSPLGDILDLDALVAWAEPVRVSPAAPLIVVAGFMLGGLLVFPVTLLIAATALLFDPLQGFVNATLGALSSAILLYLIGAFLGGDTLHRITGERVNRVSRVIARRGILTISALRIIPVAPFSVINLVAGASHIRFIDYVIGTILGMTPGIVVITLFASSLKDFVVHPCVRNILIIAGIFALALILLFLLKRHLFKDVENDA